MTDDIAGVLGLGEPYHIGLAVRDIESAMARIDQLIGGGPWGRVDAEVDAIYRGKPARSGMRGAFARMGSMYIELVEPTGGNFTAKTFIEERGEGIYHLGYWVEDMAGTLDRAEEAGLSIDWSFPAERPMAVYLGADEMLGTHLELVHPRMKSVIEGAIEQAAR